MEIEVELSKIIINESVDQQIIVLKELEGERSFPIVIGMPEILAIDRRLKDIRLPRPMTHDLVANIIENTGGIVEKIVVNDLRNGTFYALLHINIDGNTIEIDSRPSDAIAIGVGVEAPIFVDEQVFVKMQS